jgi:hypothetical protein
MFFQSKKHVSNWFNEFAGFVVGAAPFSYQLTDLSNINLIITKWFMLFIKFDIKTQANIMVNSIGMEFEEYSLTFTTSPLKHFKP